MINIPEFSAPGPFRANLEAGAYFLKIVEDDLRRHETSRGFCPVCERVQDFRIEGGPDFGPGFPNLREGLVCPCGAKNRDRLMLLASRSQLVASQRTIFFGLMSGWAGWAKRRTPETTIFCEYFGEGTPFGAERVIEETLVFNQDMTRMTFADASADLVLHQDVLEHIPDYRAALRETWRVLKPGGTTIFTAPFFHEMEETFVRAAVKADGSVEHFAPEERHGDPLVPEGILAFYNFGWSLLDEMRGVGFHDARIGLAYRPDLGLVSTGCPLPEWNMMPVFMIGSKSA